MAGCTGGASPIRIQINLYSDDDDDSAIHSLHLDPIKPGETVIVWSFGMPARFCFGGKVWEVRDGAVVGWEYDTQEVHGVIGADGFRASIAITY